MYIMPRLRFLRFGRILRLEPHGPFAKGERLLESAS